MDNMFIEPEEAAETLKKQDNFIILCHVSPDGDTMGSAYALGHSLATLGKKVSVKCADPLSQRFNYMKEGFAQDNIREGFVISVDVADAKLLGTLEEKYSGKINLSIDHHSSHIPFAEKTCLKLFAAAAELVYIIIKNLGVQITPVIAKCVYTGIATDTGCFRFPNTTRQSHLIAAELIETCDFGLSELNHILFDTKSKARISLEYFALSQIKYFFGGKCALIAVDKARLDTVDSEDINGISILARQIEGVEVGATIKELAPDEYKVSLRSNSYFDVSKIAEIFDGGGHFNAAGYKFKGSFQTCSDTLINEIGRIMD